MPDEPVADETQGGPPIEEGHPEAGAAMEAQEMAAQVLREAPAVPEPPEWMANMMNVAELTRAPEPERVWFNPVTGRAESSLQPAAEPARKEITMADIERTITYVGHRALCQDKEMFDRLVVVRNPEYGFLKHDSSGRRRWVKTIEAAQQYEVGSHFVQSDIRWGDSDIELLLIKEPASAIGCKLEDWFDKRFISLIQDAPNNVVTRAHMMRVLKIEPARDLDTFEKLKVWVETTFPKKRSRLNALLKSVAVDMAVDLDTVPIEAAPRGPEINIDYRLSEDETGQCTYEVRRTARTVLRLSMEEIRRWVEQEGVVNVAGIMRACSREVWQNDIEEWDYGEFATSDREDQDQSNSDAEPVGEFPRADLERFIREQDPALAERLGIGQEGQAIF